MAVRPVLRLPHPVLKQATVPVAVIGREERNLADDLMDTMAGSPACVGIAANQIGSTVRAFCIDVSGHKKADSCHGLVVLFNATLVVARERVSGREGCMSPISPATWPGPARWS